MYHTHTWWNGMATSSTSDIGTSEVSEIKLETSGSAYDASVDILKPDLQLSPS